MRHFPVYLDLGGRRVLFSGAGPVAVPKVRLLLKTPAAIEVYGRNASTEIRDWASGGRITLHQRPLGKDDIGGAALLYCANDDHGEDMRVSALASSLPVLVNIVDNLADSQFITPAIVDRDPVTVAIGTEGAAPVLARKIKADLEARLPAATGALAEIARSFRNRAAMIRSSRQRRQFWDRFFRSDGPLAWSEGGPVAAENRLRSLLVETLASSPRPGAVQLVHATDSDNLTMHARRLIEAADRVFHEAGADAGLLELARREAEMTCFRGGERRDLVLSRHAMNGAQVAWIGSGGSASAVLAGQLLRALDGRGIRCEFHSDQPGRTRPVAFAGAH